MLKVSDDVDYIIKVDAIRGAFDLLFDNIANLNWFIDSLKLCFVKVLQIAKKVQLIHYQCIF